MLLANRLGEDDVVHAPLLAIGKEMVSGTFFRRMHRTDAAAAVHLDQVPHRLALARRPSGNGVRDIFPTCKELGQVHFCLSRLRVMSGR